MPRITDLPSLSSPSGADLIPIVDESSTAVTKSVTLDVLGTFIGSNYSLEGSLEGNAVGIINMSGNNFNLGSGTGTDGASIYMDGGNVYFPTLDGNYSTPAWIGTGSFGEFGGISQFCFVGYEENWQNGVLSLSGPDDISPNNMVTNSINGPVGTLTSFVGNDLAIQAFAGQLVTINFDTNNNWCIYSPDSGETLNLWCGDANKGINFSEFTSGIALNILGNFINLNDGSGSDGGRINIDGGQLRDNSALIYSNNTFYGAFHGDGSNLTNIPGNLGSIINNILVDGSGNVITSGGFVLIGEL